MEYVYNVFFLGYYFNNINRSTITYNLKKTWETGALLLGVQNATNLSINPLKKFVIKMRVSYITNSKISLQSINVIVVITTKSRR